MELPTFLNKEIIIVFLVIYAIVGLLGYLISSKRGSIGLICFSLILLFGAITHYFFKISFIPKLLPYAFLPALVLGLVLGLTNYEPKAEPIKDVRIKVRGRTITIRNVFAGVGIFGASRSGKTASVIYSLLVHFSKFEFSGLVYDYKNGELTEICLPLFGERLKIFAIHRPDIGIRLNPINPKYLEDEKNVTAVAKVLLDNLGGTEKGDGGFFYETAESLLSSLILKFSLHHQHFCTIPHVIAFILSVDFALKKEEASNRGLQQDAYDTFLGLKKFLIEDKRVRIQASSFILGLASEKQTAGVISTLANALRKISFPESFWALSGNELSLNLNSKDNKTVLAVLNEPKDDGPLSPFLATVIHTITNQMMVRNQEPAFILLDEAPTIKLRNMARISATMASFKIVTVYCAQDISQAVIQYTRDGFKAILANLSTLFFGRANDPDTGKFYEQYFEPKKIKTRSRTTGNSSSTTIGEREIPKVRSHEFTKFTPGKFAFISGGKAELIRFPKYDIKVEPLPEKENLQKKMIENYSDIIDDVNLFAEQIGISLEKKV
jgi:type IV secretory pathway TraG/TraD family ATPase VirD4